MVSYELQRYEREIKLLSIRVMRMRINVLPALIKQRDARVAGFQPYLQLLHKVSLARKAINELLETVAFYHRKIRQTGYDPRIGQTKQHRNGKIGSLNDNLNRQIPHLKDLSRQLDKFVKDTESIRSAEQEKETMELLSTIEVVPQDDYRQFQENVQAFDLLVATVYLLVKILKK